MKYYDIHTHKQSSDADTISIVSCSTPFSEIPSTCFISAGLHPWHIDTNYFLSLMSLKELSLKPSLVAIGESGIDKLISTSVDLQKEVFLYHVRISEGAAKPIVIHCVKAWNELIQIRRQANPSQLWIIHGFRGKATLAAQLIKEGFSLSFGPFYNIDSLKTAWPDHLFLETDDKETSIKDIYRKVADDLNMSIPQLALQIEKNVSRAFPSITNCNNEVIK